MTASPTRPRARGNHPAPATTTPTPGTTAAPHGFTIVDSPQSGTLLTAEEIEGIFVKFGGVL